MYIKQICRTEYCVQVLNILLNSLYLKIYILIFELREKYKKGRFKSFVQSEMDIFKMSNF